jgi:chemotaxis response regulator CheB
MISVPQNFARYRRRLKSLLTESVEALKTQKPDMITLDFQMTEEWGPQFYRRLAKEDEFKEIPIVVIRGLRGGIFLSEKRSDIWQNRLIPMNSLILSKRLSEVRNRRVLSGLCSMRCIIR